MTNNVTLEKILVAIESNNGEIFVVGGSIRDIILGIEPKDIDFLVRKLTLEQITNIIKTIGKAGEVGQSFGIVKGIVEGIEFDFAIPRVKEEKIGDGHADFIVQTDQFATVEDDLGRRDITFNAMAIALRDFIANDMGKIIDPHGGIEDLKKKTIRMVGDPFARFLEDNLRIMRVIQFAARMEFTIEPQTEQAIKVLAPKLKTVSGERVFEELKKAWTKGHANSRILISLLKRTDVGRVVFGEEFDPMQVDLRGLKGEDKINGMFVAFFLKGGDFQVMKPETINIKMVEVARKIAFGRDFPHTFIGALKGQLHVLEAVFLEISPLVATKVHKMMNTAILAKELAINGDDIKRLLNISDKKDFAKIGIAQKALLESIWLWDITNEKENLERKLAQLSL